jgi:hypothetical protein
VRQHVDDQPVEVEAEVGQGGVHVLSHEAVGPVAPHHVAGAQAPLRRTSADDHLDLVVALDEADHLRSPGEPDPRQLPDRLGQDGLQGGLGEEVRHRPAAGAVE